MSDSHSPLENAAEDPALATIPKQAAHSIQKSALAIVRPTWGKLIMLVVSGSVASLFAGVPSAQITLILLVAVPVLLLLLLIWTERRQLLDLIRHMIDSAEEVHITNGEFQFDYKGRPKQEMPINTRSRDDPS